MTDISRLDRLDWGNTRSNLLDQLAADLGDTKGILVAAVEGNAITHLDFHAEAPMNTDPRLVYAELTCRHEHPNEDSTYDTPCGWTGRAVVEIWDDTKEVLWICPTCSNENSELYRDYA